MYFLLNYVLSFFALFCKFRSHMFHLIMPFLFSFEFPKVQFVPLKYALPVFVWISQGSVFSTELCPTRFRLNFPRFSVFHWIMHFLFSFEFPKVQCVPFNYALLVFVWISQGSVRSIELCPSSFRLNFPRFSVFHSIMPFLFSFELPKVQCVPLKYALPVFVWTSQGSVCSIELCPSCFRLNFSRFSVFHWIMPFQFSFEFPKVQCVPLNYALPVFIWISQGSVCSIEICPSCFRLNFPRFSVFLWNMPFLLSFEFPKVQCVPFNYALPAFVWIFQGSVCSI